MSTKKIAITGGIGSGKSTVCDIIKEMGYPIFSCDQIYSDLLKDELFLKGVSNVTGIPLLKTENGYSLDRQGVSNAVFNDKQLRGKLESFTHPAIMQELDLRMSKHKGIVFAEVPLLFEKGFEKQFDAVIVVMRDVRDRISAVKIRDGLSEENISARIKNQFDYENFAKTEHTLLYNNSDITELKDKVCLIIESFI